MTTRAERLVTIWILVWDGRHGTDVAIYLSEKECHDEIRCYIDERIDEQKDDPEFMARLPKYGMGNWSDALDYVDGDTYVSISERTFPLKELFAAASGGGNYKTTQGDKT